MSKRNRRGNKHRGPLTQPPAQAPEAKPGSTLSGGYKPKIDPYGEFKERVEANSLILWDGLPPEKPRTIAERTRMRWTPDGRHKKTLVVMGTSPDSCGLAPWDESGIDEFWALNDAHNLEFMRLDKITRWFQLHQPWRYRRPTPRFGRQHWDWLKEEHHFPIYMQRVDPEVPNSVRYPIEELAKEFLFNDNYGEWLITRGDGYQRKYFSCSFSFLAALALHEGFERIEMYGVELAQQQEYVMQRPNTEFWLGLCIGRGVQLYVPRVTRVLQGEFYAYRYPSLAHQRAEIAKKKAEGKPVEWEPGPETVDEDNVGEFPEVVREPLIDLSKFPSADIVKSYNGNGAKEAQPEEVP